LKHITNKTTTHFGSNLIQDLASGFLTRIIILYNSTTLSCTCCIRQLATLLLAKVCTIPTLIF